MLYVLVSASPGTSLPNRISWAGFALSSVLLDLPRLLWHCLLAPFHIVHTPLRYSYISLTTPQLVFFGYRSEIQRSALNAAAETGVHLRARLMVNQAGRGELGEVGFEFGGGCVKSLVKMSTSTTFWTSSSSIMTTGSSMFSVLLTIELVVAGRWS